MRANAGLRFLNRSMPDLKEAKDAFENIVVAGHRTVEVIESVRTLFKTQNQNSASFDVNKLIEDTLALVGEDLRKHRISVERKLKEHLPQATGDRVQLQQVLLNLMTNAIDSIADIDVPHSVRFSGEERVKYPIDVSRVDSFPGGPVDLPIDHQGPRRPAGPM